jgi:hypothetical protein
MDFVIDELLIDKIVHHLWLDIFVQMGKKYCNDVLSARAFNYILCYKQNGLE